MLHRLFCGHGPASLAQQEGEGGQLAFLLRGGRRFYVHRGYARCRSRYGPGYPLGDPGSLPLDRWGRRHSLAWPTLARYRNHHSLCHRLIDLWRGNRDAPGLPSLSVSFTINRLKPVLFRPLIPAEFPRPLQRVEGEKVHGRRRELWLEKRYVVTDLCRIGNPSGLSLFLSPQASRKILSSG